MLMQNILSIILILHVFTENVKKNTLITPLTKTVNFSASFLQLSGTHPHPLLIFLLLSVIILSCILSGSDFYFCL